MDVFQKMCTTVSRILPGDGCCFHHTRPPFPPKMPSSQAQYSNQNVDQRPPPTFLLQKCSARTGCSRELAWSKTGTGEASDLPPPAAATTTPPVTTRDLLRGREAAATKGGRTKECRLLDGAPSRGFTSRFIESWERWRLSGSSRLLWRRAHGVDVEVGTTKRRP